MLSYSTYALCAFITLFTYDVIIKTIAPHKNNWRFVKLSSDL